LDLDGTGVTVNISGSGRDAKTPMGSEEAGFDSSEWTSISTTGTLTIPGSRRVPPNCFKSNCWICLEPVEGSLSVLVYYIGPHKIMWATGYPHSNGFFPQSAADDPRAARAVVPRGAAPGIGQRSDGVLRR
jgi:hypothetical protein